MPKPPEATPSRPAPAAPDRTRAGWLGPVLLLAAIALAYANTLRAPFEFDDYAAIIENRSLHDFWSFAWLPPTAGGGSTVSGRPVLAFSFAVNHALGGLDVRGYHVANVAIHALNALLLFGLVRRTLRLARPDLAPATVHGLGLAAAALWALHPVQTQAVTYIVQRAESLMALFYLATAYLFLRGAGSSRPWRWWGAAVAACLAGMGTKEVMVSAPVMLLLFDRAFLAGSWREIWQRRKAVHAALAATWLPLLWLVASLGGNRGGSTGGFGEQAAAIPYWLTQFPAIVTYLKLAVWPAPLVFEYGPVWYRHPGEVWPEALLVLTLAGATVAAWFRRPRLGFAGLFFFAILAPTSVVPGTMQMTVEHRLYLALAPLAVLAVVAAQRVPGLRAVWAAGGVAVLFGGLTALRNEDYRSELALWGDTVAKRPANPRAHHNLGRALDRAGRTDEAMAAYRRALALQPNHALAHQSLGEALLARGRADEALAHFQAALAADSGFTAARVNLGRTLGLLGRTDEAMRAYETVLAAEPAATDARTNLAALLIGRGRAAEAAAMLRAVLADDPGLAEAHYHLGMALEKQGGQPAAAEAEFRAALELKPGLAEAHLALGNRLLQTGNQPGAEASYREALRLAPRLAGAHYAVGNLHAMRREFDAAIQAYHAALAADPQHWEALANLGNCQLVTGRVHEAVGSYERVLQHRPADAAVRRNLELAREFLRTGRPPGGG